VGACRRYRVRSSVSRPRLSLLLPCLSCARRVLTPNTAIFWQAHGCDTGGYLLIEVYRLPADRQGNGAGLQTLDVYSKMAGEVGTTRARVKALVDRDFKVEEAKAADTLPSSRDAVQRSLCCWPRLHPLLHLGAAAFAPNAAAARAPACVSEHLRAFGELRAHTSTCARTTRSMRRRSGSTRTTAPCRTSPLARGLCPAHGVRLKLPPLPALPPRLLMTGEPPSPTMVGWTLLSLYA